MISQEPLRFYSWLIIICHALPDLWGAEGKSDAVPSLAPYVFIVALQTTDLLCADAQVNNSGHQLKSDTVGTYVAFFIWT